MFGASSELSSVMEFGFYDAPPTARWFSKKPLRGARREEKIGGAPASPA